MQTELTFDRAALAEQRQFAGLSIRKLAETADVSFSQLAAIERGDSQPTPATVKKLTEALGLDSGGLYRRAS